MMIIRKMRCKKCQKDISFIQTCESVKCSRDFVIAKGHVFEMDREYLEGDIHELLYYCDCGLNEISIKETDQMFNFINERKRHDLLNEFELGSLCDELELYESNESLYQ